MTHPTAWLEIVGGLLGSFLRGLVMLIAPLGTLPLESRHGTQAWGLLFMALGALQCSYAGGRYAEARGWVATATMTVFGARLATGAYVGSINWMQDVVFLLSPFLVQVIIAWRAWHDLEVAGLSVDRRHSPG